MEKEEEKQHPNKLAQWYLSTPSKWKEIKSANMMREICEEVKWNQYYISLEMLKKLKKEAKV